MKYSVMFPHFASLQICSCVLFALCATALTLAKERYISLYRDHSLEYVADFSRTIEKNFTIFAQCIIWFGIFISIGRMVACHLLIVGAVFRELVFMWPHIIVNSIGIVFTVIVILVGYLLDTQMTAKEFLDFHGCSIAIYATALVTQIVFLIFVALDLKSVRKSLKNVNWFGIKQRSPYKNQP